MIRVMLGQRTQDVYDENIKELARETAERFESVGFHVTPIVSMSDFFFVSVWSKDATLTMGESYARDIIAAVQSAGIPMVISQVRFNREDGDPS